MLTQTENSTLFLEDNPGDLELLKENLQKAGWPLHNVIHKVRLADAVAATQKNKPTIAFVDLNVPDSNGLNTFLEIQKSLPDVPIIIVTSVNDMSLSLEAVQKGAQDYLVKGRFEEHSLLKVVLHSIERKRTNEKLREANERYELAGKANNEAMWDLDLRNDEMVWNHQVAIFGYDDTVKKDLYWQEDHIHPKDKKRVISRFQQLDNVQQQQLEIEYRFRCANGSYKYILDRRFILRDYANNIYRIIGTMQDMTDKKALQRQIEQLKAQKAKIALVASIEGQEREKKWLSLELHDNINQILAATRSYLTTARKSSAELRNMIIEQAQTFLGNAIEEIRNLSHDMSGMNLAELGLKASLQEFVQRTMKAHDIEITLTINDENLSEAAQLHIYRIVQEQTGNILKHASANNVNISLAFKKHFVELIITDDGAGADLGRKRMGIGLLNIQNRTEILGGKLEIETALGKGFTCKAVFPKKEIERKADPENNSTA